MAKRLTAERRNEIAGILLRDGNIKAGELAQRFGVSTETIRKDLLYLQEQGLARKSYGGALASRALLERPIALKEMEYTENKTAIAVQAKEFVPENGVILLDAGTTNYTLARQLLTAKGLTIFTNSIMVLNLLADSENQVFALGGRVRGSSKGIVGAWALEALKSIHLDAAFLGTDGFRDLAGPTSASYEEAEFKRQVMARSSRSYILGDSSKFSVNSLFTFCDWSEITALITNDCDEEDFLRCRSRIREKTEVICVS